MFSRIGIARSMVVCLSLLIRNIVKITLRWAKKLFQVWKIEEKLDRMIAPGNYQYAGGIGWAKFFGKRISE